MNVAEIGRQCRELENLFGTADVSMETFSDNSGTVKVKLPGLFSRSFFCTVNKPGSVEAAFGNAHDYIVAQSRT